MAQSNTTGVHIKRLGKIADYRVFQDWSINSEALPFARVNLIYGTNGSGKSTLANLFRDGATGDLHGSTGLKLPIIVDGDPVDATENHSRFWQAVRVFNAAYLNENLRFDDANGPSPDSLLTLGKIKVDSERELEESRTARDVLRAELRIVEAKLKKQKADHAKSFTTLAGQIVEELRRSGVAKYRATNTYTRRNVQDAIRHLEAQELPQKFNISEDLQLALAASPEMLQVSPLDVPQPRYDDVRLFELLNRRITAEVLDDVRDAPHGARWVQEGISLHNSRTHCLFCGETISSERRRRLEAHFDDSVRTLQREAESAIEEIESSLKAIYAFGSRWSSPPQVYADLKTQLDEALAVFRAQSLEAEELVRPTIDALRVRRDSPFAPSPEFTPSAVQVPDAAPVLAVLAAHNERARQHETVASDAAQRVELARVQSAAPGIAVAGRNVAKLVEQQQELTEKLGGLDTRIIELAHVEADPLPKAEMLTSDTARLLGRSDLAFFYDEVTGRYRINRSGKPATHLSEGERTAIALLYFLASARDGAVGEDAPILIIDDPVSSLDDSILYGVSSHLWADLVTRAHAAQVFILTHKFELFRQWVIQLDTSKRFINGGFTVHELRMKHVEVTEQDVRRIPQLSPWAVNGPLSKRLRSQYHFLFARVANALIEASSGVGLAERMELLSLTPNAARKMLEAFLSFRYPLYMGDFQGGVRAAMDDVADAAVRTRIVRYLHAYSHNEEGDISTMLDPSEVGPVIQSLFRMIELLDERHFSSMCESLDIDPAELLR